MAPNYEFSLDEKSSSYTEVVAINGIHQQPTETIIGSGETGKFPLRKRIGIITSGSDAPGMNACIRAIVRVAAAYGFDTIGIQNGFEGLAQASDIEILRGSKDDSFGGSQNPDLVLSEDDKRPFFFFNSDFTSEQPPSRNRRLTAGLHDCSPGWIDPFVAPVCQTSPRGCSPRYPGKH